MGRKDRKEFGQNPFSTLKGFSASPPPREKPAPQATPTSTIPEAEADFGAEMEWLGVRRLADVEEPTAAPIPATETEPPTPAAAPPDEAEEFRRALGGLQVTFRDEYPDEHEPQAAPRRMKLVRQGKLAPEATLDLHGLSREEARRRTRYFLENSIHHGYRTVLLITGRGQHSAVGPVLRDDLERYLSFDAAAWVVEWGRAPGVLGGDGALVVFLKGKKEQKG